MRSPRLEDELRPVGEFEEPPSMGSAEAAVPEDGPRARPYPARVPDGEYLAVCKTFYWHRASRSYGERIYLTFEIFGGEFNRTPLRMFLRPSAYPTSNFYRAWSIANGGPPRSRNTKMSPRIFEGKLFTIKTATVKPRQRLTGEKGKSVSGPELPAEFWYSKVDCLMGLEVGGEETVN